jgi:methyl-accepting chemotaxis protein
MNWTVGRKIAAGYALAVLALLVIGVVAFLATRKLISAGQGVAHTHDVLAKLDDVVTTLKDAESAQRGFIITGDDTFLKESYNSAAKQADQDMDYLLDSTALDPDQKPRLEDLRKLVDARFQELKDLLDARKDDTDESLHAAREVIKDNRKNKRTMAQIGQKVDELKKREQALRDHSIQEAGVVADLATYVIAIGIPLTLGFVAVAGFLITRSIAPPLGEITAAAGRLAAGDLGVKLAIGERGDEIGALARTFARMIASLQAMAGVAERIAAGDLSAAVAPQSDRDVLGNAFQKMIAALQSMATVAERIAAGDLKAQPTPQSDKDVLGTAFATMTRNLRQIMADLAEGANVLGTASAQIVASTTELAAGSVQTASAVTETTSTVEEVRQTSQISSAKAKYVAESAQRAAAISESGKKTTDDAIEGMGRIRQQMSAIADSMVRLSEQTQAIGQIIATVDDLSQQSNLLAVNASIEAAKAGEQGKGFAVVAQEVRSLAAQSKIATTQVRTILSDIQKATAAAAMATEQGTKAVEAGVRQSGEAGNSILKLAGGVNEAAEAAGQIAASSEQQLAGMEQVATAMESIKQASTQNVDSARQLETAARNLERVGQRLTEMVGRYKV